MREPDSGELVYSSLGMAVLACQVFEVVFVMSARLALKQAQAVTIEDVVPISLEKASRQAISALLKELQTASSVDPALESRVRSFLEDRNRIIHREYLLTKLPMHDPAWRETFIRRCIAVAAEARDLTVAFSQLLLAWWAKFPDTAEQSNMRLEELLQVVRNFQYGA